VTRLVDRAERSVIVHSPLIADESASSGSPQDEVLQELKRAWPGDGDRDGLGLVKRGRLLPTPRVGITKPPFDTTYETLDALFAPAPTYLRFAIDVPDGGRLTFSYALAAGSRAGNDVTFEVRVSRRGETGELFSDTIDAASGLFWRQAAVDLGRWAGKRVDLELVTTSGGARGFALWGNPVIDGPRRATEPPNVIVIGIDTLRADRLSAYGYERPTSPQIDALAAEAIRFDQAISAANWTAPSFASIFTGLPASRHGVRTDPGRWTPAEAKGSTSRLSPLGEDVRTLAEIFRQGGWRTQGVAFKPALFDVGLDQGFESWFNLPTPRLTGRMNLDRALTWLESNHDRRFFLFLHLNDPHQPFNQPAAFQNLFGGDERARLGFDLPITIARGAVDGCPPCYRGAVVSRDFVTAARDLYDGEIAFVDDLVGRLLAALREWGVYEDTLIALISDHGEILFEQRGFFGHGGRFVTDSLVRVPLIVKPHAGAALPSGIVIDDQVRSTDLLPTLVDLAGLEPLSETADSRSLRELISGDGRETSRPAFSENPQMNLVGLRHGRWKLVLTTNNGRTKHALYDLEADRLESRNVAKRHPDELARLAEVVVPFFLRSRPGPFLLALGDGSPGEFELVVESSDGDSATTHILGIPPRAKDSEATTPVEAQGRVIAFAQLTLAPDAAIRARLVSGDRIVASRAATLDRMLSHRDDVFSSLLDLETPDIYFLHGAPDLSSTAAPAPANPDQLEELRALGYID
jgi:arylsulfatase A-like enzyme